MYKTKNDLSESVRAKVCALLSQRLADAIDLAYQAKQAHWNVKGMQFKSLHELFDSVHETTVKYVDEFAERIVQLGEVAEGTVRVAAERSSLPEYPLQLLPALDHVEALSDRLADFGEAVRAAIEESDDAGDFVTADIFTDAARDIDKLTWMLEAFLMEVGQMRRARRAA